MSKDSLPRFQSSGKWPLYVYGPAHQAELKQIGKAHNGMIGMGLIQGLGPPARAATRASRIMSTEIRRFTGLILNPTAGNRTDGGMGMGGGGGAGAAWQAALPDGEEEEAPTPTPAAAAGSSPRRVLYGKGKEGDGVPDDGRNGNGNANANASDTPEKTKRGGGGGGPEVEAEAEEEFVPGSRVLTKGDILSSQFQHDSL